MTASMWIKLSSVFYGLQFDRGSDLFYVDFIL